MEHQALDIIDMLYTMIAEAWGVPLGNDKCIVERDKALSLLDDLKSQLPMELSEARRLVSARDEFVSSAKREAETIRHNAEEEAAQLLDQQNIYQEACRRADERVRFAEERSKEILRTASSYLDDALRQTEETVATALDNVRTARAQFRAVSAPEPEGSVEVTMQDVENQEIMEESDGMVEMDDLNFIGR